MTFKFAIGTLISFVMAACAAPAAQESQVPSDPAAPTALVPAFGSGTPTPIAPAPTTTSDPTGTPAPSLAFEAPDDILPPLSLARVVVDGLNIRYPTLDGPVVETAAAGEVLFVRGGGGPAKVDGFDWYQVDFVSGWDGWPAHPPGTQNSWTGWAAAGSGAERYLELVPPDCPEADPELATLVLMTPWEHLACFGDRPLTFEGTYGCAGCGGTTAGDFEPAWLAYPMNFDWLFADYASGSGYLELRFAPDSGLERPPGGAIVRVTGHFNDPRSATCRMVTFEGDQETPLDSPLAELTCKERFVVDGLDVIGTDPDFP